ncbi:Ornithine decarboxylase [Lecanora helva]
MPTSHYVSSIRPKEIVLDDNTHPDHSPVARCLKTHVSSQHSRDNPEEESFFVVDLGEVHRQHSRWIRNLKRVKPFYVPAVKCNPDVEVLRLLARLGTGFDCSSRHEIEQCLDLGVDSNRILYANPCKAKSHIRYARSMGVRRMTFDSTDELYKIKAIFPDAELLLRIATDDSSSICGFNQKFGAPLESTRQLLEVASQLGLEIAGVSFHVGTASINPRVFVQAVRDSRIVFDLAQELGHSLRVLDVGGGFSTGSFEAISQTLATALDEYFSGDIELISEPGRYFVESAFTLACNIIARRGIGKEASCPSYMLYLNDGVYRNFMDCLLSHWRPKPRILNSTSENMPRKEIHYSIWGPTCDGVDQIIEDVALPKDLDVGDWLYFENMGAYTSCLATSFNGFSSKQIVYYVSSEPTERALALSL